MRITRKNLRRLMLQELKKLQFEVALPGGEPERFGPDISSLEALSASLVDQINGCVMLVDPLEKVAISKNKVTYQAVALDYTVENDENDYLVTLTIEKEKSEEL